MTLAIVIELTCTECGSGLPGGGWCPICRVAAIEAAYTVDDSPTCRCGAVLRPLEHACWQCRSFGQQSQAAARLSQVDWLEVPRER